MNKFTKTLTTLVVMVSLVATPMFAFGNKHKFNKLQENQHKSMHEIVMVNRSEDGTVVGGGLCTAYAIGPHTLLTAEHCNDTQTNEVYIDAPLELIRPQKVTPYKIISRAFDHQDHMLLDVSGINFKNTIVLTDHVRAPRQGEHTYSWGNPAGIRDQYREGLVMGNMPNPKADPDDAEKIDATGTVYLIAEPVIGGDSGSSIFSAEDNQLIGIVTYGIDEGQIAGMYAVVFTQTQINESLK